MPIPSRWSRLVKRWTICSNLAVSPSCNDDSALAAKLWPRLSALPSSSRRSASFVVRTSYHDEASETNVTPRINAMINRKLRIFILRQSFCRKLKNQSRRGLPKQEDLVNLSSHPFPIAGQGLVDQTDLIHY